MKIVSSANNTVLNILNTFKKNGKSFRLMKYCVQACVEEGVLLFNLLTRELLMLTHQEYSEIEQGITVCSCADTITSPVCDYLKNNWFLVPSDINEKECTDFVKFFLKSRVKKSGNITGYTIFTTTDCNARCFYCFELGRSRIPMSQETALKTVQYIKEHCGGKPVRFRWFGGEPLLNYSVIDTICEGLKKENIEYTSTIVSNGYLFDDVIVDKAQNNWKIKKVQITLDGTEKIYNKVKAFVYKEGNPYQIVLNNIEKLLNAHIAVIIRLNMDLHNAEDLLALAQELANRFGGRKGLSVYAHHLFKDGVPMADMHTEEEWKKRDEAMQKIEFTLRENGLTSKAGIPKKFRTNHCMADSGESVTILPDGHLGLCEHHTECEFIGHLDSDILDEDKIASWKETTPEVPECADCFYFPDCMFLKKCSNSSVCYPQHRTNIFRKLQQCMINEYENWKSNNQSDEDEESDELL